jgi:hypothetical protein
MSQNNFQMTPKETLKIGAKRLRFICRNFRLFVFLMQHRNAPADTLFREAWRMFDRKTAPTAIGNNFRQIPDRHFRHYNFRHFFKYLFPSFLPEIKLDQSVISAIGSQKSIIATIHSKSEYAILAALERAGLRTAMITASSMNVSKLETYGIKKPPLGILRTPGAFIEARSALRDGYTLVCDVDYVLGRRYMNVERYISASLFDFQRVVGAQMFFAYTRIDENGQIECIVEQARHSSAQPSFLSAAQFIEFIDKVQGQPSGLKVANWSMHKSQRQRKN